MANERVWSLATIGEFWNKVKNLVSGYKPKQTAVSDPSASGTGVTFIDSISQDTQGVINPTKKTVRNASQSQSGLMSSTDKKKLDELAGDTLPVTSGAATTMKEYVDDFSIEMVPEYDDEETYAIGDYVQYEELVYRCKVAITIAESWTSAHWERANIAEELAKANAIRDDIGVVINGNKASQNVTSGQYVIVRNSTISGISDGLYKASANIASGTAFTSANLTPVSNGAANSLQSQVTSLSSNIANIIEQKQIGSSQFDLNSLTNISCVYWTSAQKDNVLNKPKNTAGFVATFSSGGRLLQFFNNTASDFYVRYGMGDSWKDWVHFSSNKETTIAVPKSNGTASVTYSSMSMTDGRVYLVTAMAPSNNAWRYAGILYFQGTRTLIYAIVQESSNLTVTADSTKLTFTNTNTDYDATITVQVIGY